MKNQLEQNLKSIILKLVEGKATQAEKEHLQAKFQLRQIKIGGNANNANVISGDNNLIISLDIGVDVLERLISPPYVPDQLSDTETPQIHGVLPPGSHLKFSRNEIFTGREADLITIAYPTVAKKTKGPDQTGPFLRCVS